MLEIQRHRRTRSREEVHFTRRLLHAHLGIGPVVVALLLFHELFLWSLGVTGWYLLTLLFLSGMLSARNWCRSALALMFISFTVIGVYFLAQVAPHLRPENPPLLAHTLLPYWLGMLDILYSIAALCVLVNPQVRKASTLGFTLW